MPVLDQHLMTLAEAANRLPGRPHLNTLHRWARKGVDGVKLETWKIGGNVVTSVEALERFILARSGQSTLPVKSKPSASHAAAEAKLDAMGVA